MSRLAFPLAWAAILLACLAVLFLTGCTTSPEPGIEVRTVEVLVETQKPCPATRPVLPGALGALPDDARAALAKALAKLAEYSGDGQYADRAELYFDTCPSA